jgi:hypothetical protein
MRFKAVVAFALAVCACAAHASGADGPFDVFVNRSSPDVGLGKYEAGELGVVLPSFPRIYLYPAWRAIVLGREGLAKYPVASGGLNAAVGRETDGWTLGQGAMGRWLEVTAKYVQRPVRTGAGSMRTPMRGEVASFLNCTDGAFDFALVNLKALEQRPDAQPDRLRDWVVAQDAVFDFCDADSATKPPTWRAPRPRPAMLRPLADSEPLYWRQLREYQIASAHFYDEAWDESTRRFDRIAATSGHPMQNWGAYLALRSALRAANDFNPENDAGEAAGKALLAQLGTRAASILADKRLEHLYEPTRALLRIAASRLTPKSRFETLSDYLVDARSDPYRASALGDWRRLANRLIEYGQRTEATETALRKKYAFLDWMRTMQRCAVGSSRQEAKEVCPAEREHASATWQAAKGDEKRAWLVAALSVNDTLEPALEQAALRVNADAPEYMTVRYHLARLYRLAGKLERTREISQAMLQSPLLARSRSDSAQVLFLQERFATATSRDDAAAYLQRVMRWQIDRDTRELVERHPADVALASDGTRWLNRRLAVSDLISLAQDTRLAALVRAQIAVAAWMRADLLGQAQAAEKAATLALAYPGLRDAAQAYLAAPASNRQHVLIVAALKLGLSPQVGQIFGTADFLNPPKPISPQEEQPTASMWCRIAMPPAEQPDMQDWAAIAEHSPPPPDLSADPGARDRELQVLANVRTATGFVGQHALAWARTHADDPEVPWLLHVVVMSTRGGCVDPDNSRMSRAAWQLLHTRYAASSWAGRTPYWY